jgi:hypothetical protein
MAISASSSRQARRQTKMTDKFPAPCEPDLPERFRQEATLNAPDFATFYANQKGAAGGYIDYPTLEKAEGFSAIAPRFSEPRGAFKSVDGNRCHAETGATRQAFRKLSANCDSHKHRLRNLTRAHRPDVIMQCATHRWLYLFPVHRKARC